MEGAGGTSSAVVVGVAGLYLAACLVVGMWPGRRQSDSATGYVAGDRGFGLLVMYFVTGATIFSAFAFLGGPERAYLQGGAAYYILGYGILGFVPFYFLGPRAARLGRRYGFVTQAEMVAGRFRTPAIAGLMALVSVLAFVPYLGLQMKGAGLVVETMTRGAVPQWAGALVVYAVVTTYVLKSGVLGVGWTNVFQGVFMLALAWALGLWLPHRLYGGVGEMFRRIEEVRPGFVLAPGLTPAGEPWPWSEYSSAIVVTTIGFSCWPHLFMKAFSAKRERTLRQTVVLYPTFKIFLVPILLIGFAAVLHPERPEDTGQVLPFLLMSLDLPAFVVGLFCAGALAASMSSGDAMAHATASIVVRDGLIAAGGRELSPHAQRTAIRAVVVVVMVAAYVVAMLTDATLVNLLLKYAYGPVVQFAPPLFAALYLRRASGAGVLAGLAAGVGGEPRLPLQPGPAAVGGPRGALRAGGERGRAGRVDGPGAARARGRGSRVLARGRDTGGVALVARRSGPGRGVSSWRSSPCTAPARVPVAVGPRLESGRNRERVAAGVERGQLALDARVAGLEVAGALPSAAGLGSTGFAPVDVPDLVPQLEVVRREPRAGLGEELVVHDGWCFASESRSSAGAEDVRARSRRTGTSRSRIGFIGPLLARGFGLATGVSVLLPRNGTGALDA